MYVCMYVCMNGRMCFRVWSTFFTTVLADLAESFTPGFEGVASIVCRMNWLLQYPLQCVLEISMTRTLDDVGCEGVCVAYHQYEDSTIHVKGTRVISRMDIGFRIATV